MAICFSCSHPAIVGRIMDHRLYCDFHWEGYRRVIAYEDEINAGIRAILLRDAPEAQYWWLD